MGWAIAEKIVQKKANYMLAVKGNRPTLLEEMKTCFRSHWNIENRLHWMLDAVFHMEQEWRGRGNQMNGGARKDGQEAGSSLPV